MTDSITQKSNVEDTLQQRIARKAAALGVSVCSLRAELSLRKCREDGTDLEVLLAIRKAYLDEDSAAFEQDAEDMDRVELEAAWLDWILQSERLRQLWDEDLERCFVALRLLCEKKGRGEG